MLNEPPAGRALATMPIERIASLPLAGADGTGELLALRAERAALGDVGVLADDLLVIRRHGNDPAELARQVRPGDVVAAVVDRLVSAGHVRQAGDTWSSTPPMYTPSWAGWCCWGGWSRPPTTRCNTHTTVSRGRTCMKILGPLAAVAFIPALYLGVDPGIHRRAAPRAPRLPAATRTERTKQAQVAQHRDAVVRAS